MDCPKHPGSPIVSVCVTCGTSLVCVECMTDESHQAHVFHKMRRVANDMKSKLKPKEAEYRRFASSLESDINEMLKLQTQQEDDQKERVKRIDKQKEEIIDAVTKMADSLKSQYEAETQNNIGQLQRGIDKGSEKLGKVKQHSDKVKRVIDEKNDIKVINDLQKLEDTDGTRDPLPKLETIDFTPGKVNDRQLKLMFGGTASEMEEIASLQGAEIATYMSLSTYKGSDFIGTVIRHGRELIPLTSFQHSSKSVIQMCCSCRDKSWIKCLDQREITLKTKHGHKEKTVKFNSDVHGMTIVNDDTLLICGLEDRDIKQVKLSTGKVTSLFSTGKLYPRYICMSPEGDLYVTLMDQSDSNVTADSERVLVRYSAQGQEKGRARHDGRGDFLFNWPLRVRTNCDVVGVINDTDEYNSHLVLLNTDLTLRLRYLGNGKVVSGEEKFDTTNYKPDTNYAITDFIFGPLDSIIICEAYSRSVQLLYRDCVPMTTILPTQDYVPYSITITTNDEVWLGFFNGSVKVYK